MKMSLVVFFVMVFAACADEPIPLWPKGAPDEKGDIGKESGAAKPDGRPEDAKQVIRLGNVSQPTITVYRPSKEKETGTAVVVCPGGGYSILAYNLEGTEVCEWLNSIGVTGVLLKYRVPQRPGDDKHKLPLQDAQRAMRLVRHNAKAWGVNPQRVGVLGFSAGGHLSVNLCNNYNLSAYEPVDEADKENARPDFALPIYPAYLVSGDKSKLAQELNVASNTPPTFLIQTQDDVIQVENSVTYYLALRNARVPVEMHLYPVGGHGYGLRPSDKVVTTWPKRAEEWLRSLGLLAPAQDN